MDFRDDGFQLKKDIEEIKKSIGELKNKVNSQEGICNEKWTPEKLIEFEEEIREIYEAGGIKAPVHFARGNEAQLIEIFKNVKKEDWVFSNHRAHYHALLKGVRREWLKNEILDCRSIHINNNKEKVYTSSIVGGALPVAVGVALGIKLKQGTERVWCFVGDMCAEMGAFHEAEKYSRRHNLPITFVVEDNDLSVDTMTQEVWGKEDFGRTQTIRYKYKRFYPHHGSGKWVTF